MKSLWTLLTGNHFSVSHIMSDFASIEARLMSHAKNKADEWETNIAKVDWFETLSKAAKREQELAERTAEKIRTFLQ